jgi:hypothetical protein
MSSSVSVAVGDADAVSDSAVAREARLEALDLGAADDASVGNDVPPAPVEDIEAARRDGPHVGERDGRDGRRAAVAADDGYPVCDAVLGRVDADAPGFSGGWARSMGQVVLHGSRSLSAAVLGAQEEERQVPGGLTAGGQVAVRDVERQGRGAPCAPISPGGNRGRMPCQ